jgi:hypothetical protein
MPSIALGAVRRIRTKLRIPNIETVRVFGRCDRTLHNGKRRPQADAFKGEVYLELLRGLGALARGLECQEEPLAARNVRLRVSGAQAIEMIMPASKTPASIIMV